MIDEPAADRDGTDLAKARKRIDELQEESDEYDYILGRQVELLTGVANALKGQPPPLRLHDHSDLPAVAAAVMAELNQYRAITEDLRQADLDICDKPLEEVVDVMQRREQALDRLLAIGEGNADE